MKCVFFLWIWEFSAVFQYYLGGLDASFIKVILL